MLVTFRLPGRPETWKRTTTIMRGGKLLRVTPKVMRIAKRRVALFASAVKTRAWPTHQRYALAVRIVLPHRGSEGDNDNYGKLIMDALENVMWDNDKQIDLLIVSKELGEPRTEVSALALEETAFGPLLERAFDFVQSWGRGKDDAISTARAHLE